MSPDQQKERTVKLLIAIKKFMEADGDKLTITELKDFSNSLSAADREQFARELTELMGEEVVTA